MADITMEIDWIVQGVFDPDTGVDFAYTIGLADRGLPEVHLWCQPTDGTDAGAGWRLSQRDMQSKLNEVGCALAAGRRAVGDHGSTTLDCGLTTVHWHLGEPVDREVVHAYGIDDDAIVVPLRWELERSTITPPPEAEQRRIHLELTCRLAALAATAGQVDVDNATFGPAAPSIAMTRALGTAAVPSVFLRAVAGSDGEERWMAGVLRTLLDAAGRQSLADAVSDVATADGRQLAGRISDADPKFVRGVGSLFGDVLRACYFAIAAADLLHHLDEPRALHWADLAANLLDAITNFDLASEALGDREAEAFELVGLAHQLGVLGAEADRAAMYLGWWAVTRHAIRLDVHRWMDRAEDAGCDDDELLGGAAEAVNAWAVADLPDAPPSWTAAIVPFVEALRS